MKIKLLTFILMVIAVAGCKKDDTVTYPINYYGDRIEVQSKTRLFSKNGEIKDPIQIAEFTAGVEQFSDVIPEASAVEKNVLAATLLSFNEARFGENPEKFSIEKKDNQYLFYAATEYRFTSEIEILTQLGKHSRKTNTFEPHQAWQTTWTYLGHEVKVAYGNQKELRFPRLAYYLAKKSDNGITSYAYGGWFNNEFNEGALAYLREGELLAIKVYDVVCKSR